VPVARRQALTAWARATGALILEDDYDGEFRYDVAPLPALYSLAPDVVVYLGTASKMLTPVLGIGWLTARPDLIGLLAAKRRETSDRVPEPVQHALLALLEPGDEVVLLGRQGDEAITADDWAALVGTISYEVVCGVGPRMPRIVINRPDEPGA